MRLLLIEDDEMIGETRSRRDASRRLRHRLSCDGVQGSGLGLAIAARIAKRLGLALTLRNRTDAPGLSARVDGLKPALEAAHAQRAAVG